MAREAYRARKPRPWFSIPKIRHTSSSPLPKSNASLTGLRSGTILISARSGRYNVHSMNITDDGEVSGDLKVTRFSDHGIRNFDVDAKGEMMA